MGVVRRNYSNTWLAQSSLWVNGKRPNKSFSDKKYGSRANAKREAEIWLTKIDADIHRGNFIDPHRNKISLEEFKLKVGLEKLKDRPNTKKVREDIWESYIAPYDIAEMSLKKLADDPTIIARHIQNLRKPNGDTYSRSTITKVIEVIRVLFNRAIEMDYVRKNPAKTELVRDWIPVEEQKEILYLSAFDVNAIFIDLQEYSPVYAVMIPLMSYTGFRSGEARGLLWSDVDFENNTISINKQWLDTTLEFGPPKNKSSFRTIEVPQYVMGYLKKHKETLPADCEFLFPNQRGNQNGTQILCTKPIDGGNFRGRHLKPALQRLGLSKDINVHTFRHTSVRIARESGSDVEAISKRIGHKDVSTTSRVYSKLFKSVDIKLSASLDEYLKELKIS